LTADRSTRVFESDSAVRTEEIGAELARELRPGDVVLVHGDLGAGKTTLVRGACRELGVTGPVRSPTFTIGIRHRGRVDVSHLDLYRLDDMSAEAPGLLDDYLTPDAIAFVEWPLAAGWASEPALVIDIENERGDRRRVTATDRLSFAKAAGVPSQDL
jgi:tRNA threonylcarbamoyladenosine biosynthesis protein TsaE